jgi:hypothetical protein
LPIYAQQSEISEALVSTGRVLVVSKETGDLTLRSQQGVKVLLFRGLRATPVYFATGRRATFADIEPGQSATIYYAPAGGRLLISKIVIPDPERLAGARQLLVPAQTTASQSRRGAFRVPRVPNTVR